MNDVIAALYDARSHDAAQLLGARLREVRLNAGMSLDDVERLSGGNLKCATVASYERADRMPSAGRMRELAVFYDVPISDLFPKEWDGPSSVSDPAEERVRAIAYGMARQLLEVARELGEPAA